VAASIGIFIIAELPGEAGRRIREIQQRYDPKLARLTPPHVTITGSSGVGQIPASTPVARLREALDPIAATTAPLSLPFGKPVRFMQTEIVVLPLAPHGPLRELHERIARSGLPFGRSRFAFSPHATLSYYPTLTPAVARELLSLRVDEPAIIERLQVSRTRDPQPPETLFEMVLSAGTGTRDPIPQ
jgi:2'-5' RNA ligase